MSEKFILIFDCVSMAVGCQDVNELEFRKCKKSSLQFNQVLLNFRKGLQFWLQLIHLSNSEEIAIGLHAAVLKLELFPWSRIGWNISEVTPLALFVTDLTFSKLLELKSILCCLNFQYMNLACDSSMLQST